MEWVRLTKYLHDSGESRATFYRLRDEGALLETTHYRYDPRGRIWVNLEAVTSWVEGKPVKQKHRSPKQTRHTFCSLMISAGKPLTWVIQQTGHSSLSMLEKHYAKAVRLAASKHQDYDFNQALSQARQRKGTQ